MTEPQDSNHGTLMRCMKANASGERCRKDYDHAGGHDFPATWGPEWNSGATGLTVTTYDDVFDAATAAQEAADATGVSHHVRKERATGLLVVQPSEPVDGSRFLTVWGPAEPSDPHGYLAHARYLGADAALSSVVDHYLMSESDARSILDDVDPEVMDRYPEPTLRDWEEMGDQNLFHEATGVSSQYATAAEVDALTEAWEEGRDLVWGNALQATALRVIGEIERALDVERDLERDVSELRSAAGLS